MLSARTLCVCTGADTRHPDIAPPMAQVASAARTPPTSRARCWGSRPRLGSRSRWVHARGVPGVMPLIGFTEEGFKDSSAFPGLQKV
jgi:hypothetical protein